LLLEATLEAIATGHLIGIQDMGAAGITCSTSEMSAKGEHGMKIYLDKVPTRQKNMKPFEILLSESQERMLIVIKKGKEAELQAIFDKWDLNCAQIGEVTDSKRLEFYVNDELVADVPADDLVLGGGAPVYHREYTEPAYFSEFQQFQIDEIEEPEDDKLPEIAKFLIGHPNIASRRWIAEQYDSMVGTANTSTNQPSDAAIVNVKGTNKNIVISVDCNSRYVNADPEKGTMIAVSEAARNIVCSGGEPVAITNCLNFGNPYIPEVYWHFVGAIKGMKAACEVFKTPVTGGNVSFYNQSSDEGPVFPTPTIGMLGLLEDINLKMTLDFKNEGDIIYQLGTSRNDISSSEYLYSYHKYKASPAPFLDLEEESRLQKTILELIKNKLIVSAHDVSDGGLFVTLTESAMAASKDVGFSVKTTSHKVRKDAFWFGESQSRVVVSVSKDKKEEFEILLTTNNVDFSNLGSVVAEKVCQVDGNIWFSVDDAKEEFEATLPKYLN